jgi:hypothetical protein
LLDAEIYDRLRRNPWNNDYSIRCHHTWVCFLYHFVLNINRVGNLIYHHHYGFCCCSLVPKTQRGVVLRRKKKATRAEKITWFGIIFGGFLAILIPPNLDTTTKYFGLLALALFGYIIYAEWLK